MYGRKSELIFSSSNTKIVGEKYRKYNFVEFPISFIII